MIYTAKNDRLFKTIANGKDGKEILEALLSTIFNERVEILEFIPVELSLDTESERKKTLDVLVRVDKSIINIEMNAQGLSEIVKIRNLSYLCKLFSNNIKKGEVMKLNKNAKFIREISEEEERLMISKQEGQTQGYSDGKKEGMKQGIKEEKNYNVPISVDTIIPFKT